MAGAVIYGWVGLGSVFAVRHGGLWQARRGSAWLGQLRFGVARQGGARFVLAGKVRLGTARLGMAWHGLTRQARQGLNV